jgi:acetoin utilization deacetylase AcuC-like enzyme
VAVLDVDVHHGNGTQHLFYDRADVRTASIHGDPAELFPYFSGHADETGTGPGLGANRNYPLPAATDDCGYQPALEAALEWLSTGRPVFLVVAVGYDTHEADPIGGFRLSTDYFGRRAAVIRQFGVPTVLVQEGGYGLAHLGACAAAFGRGWL